MGNAILASIAVSFPFLLAGCSQSASHDLARWPEGSSSGETGLSLTDKNLVTSLTKYDDITSSETSALTIYDDITSSETSALT